VDVHWYRAHDLVSLTGCPEFGDMIVRVRPASSRPPSKGDFSASVADDTLSLPAVFGELVRKANVQSAADFISFVDSNPGAVARTLGWQEAEVVHALRHLALMIRDVSGVDYVSALDAPVSSRATGARKPTSRPPRIGKAG